MSCIFPILQPSLYVQPENSSQEETITFLISLSCSKWLAAAFRLRPKFTALALEALPPQPASTPLLPHTPSGRRLGARSAALALPTRHDWLCGGPRRGSKPAAGDRDLVRFEGRDGSRGGSTLPREPGFPFLTPTMPPPLRVSPAPPPPSPHCPCEEAPTPTSLGGEADRHLVHSCTLQLPLGGRTLFQSSPSPRPWRPCSSFVSSPASSASPSVVGRHPPSLRLLPVPCFPPAKHFSPILSPREVNATSSLPK